jgi:hypothetical protein
MATLTYDTATDPEVLAGIEADEQESLQIGEQLEQEQQQLFAGKYRDAEELEKAYIELQKKLGSRQGDDSEDQAEETDQEQEPDEEEEETPSPMFLERLAQEAESGEFSEELIQQLDQMSARDIADMFLDYRENNIQQTEQPQAITDTDLNYYYDMVGGQEQYQNMTAWAAQNLTQEEIQAFDQVVDRGDPFSVYFAVQALNYRFMNDEGFEGELLTGRESRSGGDVFRSTAELVRAMDDPRYESDPAYRMDVEAKLERSNLQF